MTMRVEGRHPSTVHLARFFDYDHLPTGHHRAASARCEELAAAMISMLPDGPELTTGLRKLLEARDCFLRVGL